MPHHNYLFTTILAHKIWALSLLFGLAHDSLADTPLGWVNSSNMSAYTTTAGDLELSASLQAVNGAIDFLDIREDLFASNQRLQGKSGDLRGNKFEVHYGITDYLSLFGRHQEHSLVVDLGEIASANIVDIDGSLDTTQQEIGLKWTLFEADLLNPDNRQTAFSLMITGFRNETKDFDALIDQLNFTNLTIFFADPTTFSVSSMEDQGWTARAFYTRPLERLGIASVWMGYGESSATSGTSTNAVNGTIKRLFTQDFEVKEEYFYLGASLNFLLTPRWPVSLSYEYIDIAESRFQRDPVTPVTQLPGFLSSSGPSAEHANHTLQGRISYWLTPQLNVSFSGNLFSNQFLGRLPHYNNPLGESFSAAPYGFIGAELGYRF